MEYILSLIAVFLTGALVGFGLSVILNYQTILELHEENEKLKQERRSEKVTKQIIEICDPGTADGVNFPGATKIN